jgi:hypothetical protein
VAIALPRFDHAESGKFSVLEEYSGDGYAFAPRSIVLDDHDCKTAVGALIGERLQCQPQVLRPAKACNADHDPDRGVERTRRSYQCAGDFGRNLTHG